MRKTITFIIIAGALLLFSYFIRTASEGQEQRVEVVEELNKK